MNIVRLLGSILSFATNPNVTTAMVLFENVVDEIILFIPVDALKAHLSKDDKAQAEAAADVLDEVKFGPR